MRNQCITWEEAEERQRQQELKRGKKKKKAKATGKRDERVVFPWYHLLLPVTIFYLSYKYVKPTIGTSIGLLFGFVAMGLIAHKMV